MNNVAYDDTSSSSSSENEEFIISRRLKVYRKRENSFNKYDDLNFFERFRLTKPTVHSLLGQVEHPISFPINRGGYIHPLTQLLLTLRFYATGSMLISAGDFMGVSKTSACNSKKGLICHCFTASTIH